MTAATGRVTSVKPFGDGVPIPWALATSLAASVDPSRGWLMGLNATTGYAVTQAAGVTNLVSLGFADRDADSSSTAASATLLARQQFVSGYPNSTGTLDAILATDYAVACWAVDNQTVGKKSNLSGVNRSMLGLALGLDADNNTAIVYVGPIGWTLGRAAHMADNASGAEVPIADAAASTATAERAIPRKKLHGKVTAIEFVGAAIAADNTDYVTVTVSKRDGAGGAATSLGTYDTRAANNGAVAAFVPGAFTLSATAADLDLLETDVVTLTVVKGGAGKVLTGYFRVLEKVG